MIEANAVRRVAELARLDLQAGEAEALVEELLAILGHFEVLQEVDTDGVEPLVHALDRLGTAAADEPCSSATDALLSLSEHAREGFLLVPRVLAKPDADADEEA